MVLMHMIMGTSGSVVAFDHELNLCSRSSMMQDVLAM